MLTLLKNHPFAVESFFKSSLVLTYAVAKEELMHLIPECLVLDTFHDKWAFIAIAMVQTKDLRPKGLPKTFGNDFFLTGYRIFVRYTTSNGKTLRGLYILRSETDKKTMAFLGNIFTHYHYKTTDISFETDNARASIHSNKSNLHVVADLSIDEPLLPAHSPFSDWKEARRFAGPLPFTFTYNQKTKEVLIIEGVRQNWTPKPVAVLESQVGFLNELDLQKPVLANAFIIENIPYYWKKGKIDLWKQQ